MSLGRVDLVALLYLSVPHCTEIVASVPAAQGLPWSAATDE